MTNVPLRRWLVVAAPAAVITVLPLTSCSFKRKPSRSQTSEPTVAASQEPTASPSQKPAEPAPQAPVAEAPAPVAKAETPVAPEPVKPAEPPTPAPVQPAPAEPAKIEIAAAPVGGQGGEFQAAQDIEKVKAERRDFLVGQYLKLGRDAYERADFAGARTAFAEALTIDPNSKDAQNWLQRAQAALGETGPLRPQDFQDRLEFERVREAEARLKVQQEIDGGDRALELNKHDDAIQHYRTAERILGFYPLLAGERSKQKEVASKIDEALRRKDEFLRQQEVESRERAQAERMEREAQQRRMLEEQLRRLYSDANVAFMNDRFRESAENLDRLLEIDPANDRARELREIVRQAKNSEGMREARANMTRQWRQTFDEGSRFLLGQSNTIEPDKEHWAAIQDRQPLSLQVSTGETNPEDAAVLRVLETSAFEPRFANVPITEVVNFIRNLTQANVVLSQKVNEMDEGQKAVSVELPKRSVRAFLDTLKLLKNLSWRVQDGYVLIGTPEDMKSATEYRNYDVADLTQTVPNFPGPDISLIPPSGQGIPNPADPDPAPVFTGDQIVSLVQANIAPASWQDAEAKTVIRFVPSSNTLTVRQTPEVHSQLERFLNDLREITNLMVEVQTRFIIAEDNFLEDIGIDWRGLGDNGNSAVPPTGGLGNATPFDDFGASPLPGTSGQPGPLGTNNQPGFFTTTGNTPVLGKTENIFDQTLSGSNPLTNSGGLSLQWISLGDRQNEMILRATEKSQRVELVTAPRLLVHSGARSHIAVTNQFAYVAGYGVEIAQASSIADPQIDVIEDGAILDVRPVVSADRKFVKLELRPTLATLRLPIEQRTVGVGNGTPVTIQFPNLTVRKVRTTVIVPDGGTLLLGGQSVDEIRNESAGTPFLRDIPVIGFFFDRKGQSVSKRRLLILVTVKIVIPPEHEPRMPQKPSTLLQKSELNAAVQALR